MLILQVFHFPQVKSQCSLWYSGFPSAAFFSLMSPNAFFFFFSFIDEQTLGLFHLNSGTVNTTSFSFHSKSRA